MKLKVCGMKYDENIKDLLRVSPDYIGFIFYKESARYITDVPKIDFQNTRKVGVFVDASIKNITRIIKEYRLDAVQLHGNESVEFCEDLKAQIPENIKLIKVFSIRDKFDFNLLDPYEETVDFFLFDTKGELPGGNGFAFDWQVLRDYTSSKPFFLSGGIGLDSTSKIQEFLQTETGKLCHAIDVNSRFEIKPGLKDIDKIKNFKNKL